MVTRTSGTDVGPTAQAVVRSTVERMVRAVPPALVAVVAIGILLGGSPPVLALIGLVAVVSALPPVSARVPDAAQPVIATWYAVLAATVSLLALRPATFELAAAAGGTVILGARILHTVQHRRIVLAVVVGVQGLGWWVTGPVSAHMWAVVGLGLLAFGSEYLAAVHRSIEETSEQQVAELSADRVALLRLYEIASSIGASSKVDEAMPDLLQSVSAALRVRTCAMVMYHPERRRLEMAGPLWHDGATLALAEPVSLPVHTGGFSDRVLRSTRAVRFDRRTSGDLRAILDRAGLESGLLTPLRLEGLVTGLILVGNPIDGWLENEDVATLTDIAAPVSLVMSQVARLEATALLAERLQEVADMKTDLVTMVTHELRTPLTSVIGALDLLKRIGDEQDPELTDELMATADRQAHRLKRMIDDLLTVSRFDRGLMRPAPEPVDLKKLVDEAAWLVGSGAGVSIEIPSGLSVVADRDHLRQITVNLLENAGKFAADGPIQVGASQFDDGEVVLAVIDHGPGIDEDDRHRVFERFVQLSRGTHATGSGLGLAIVKMLAEGMGGRVEVFETPGGGATFAVKLPGARRGRMRPAA